MLQKMIWVLSGLCLSISSAAWATQTTPVVNPTANPLPTTIQNTPTVNVGNTSAIPVKVGAGSSITVNNNSRSPIPVTVQGTLPVTVQGEPQHFEQRFSGVWSPTLASANLRFSTPRGQTLRITSICLGPDFYFDRKVFPRVVPYLNLFFKKTSDEFPLGVVQSGCININGGINANSDDGKVYIDLLRLDNIPADQGYRVIVIGELHYGD